MLVLVYELYSIVLKQREVYNYRGEVSVLLKGDLIFSLEGENEEEDTY